MNAPRKWQPRCRTRSAADGAARLFGESTKHVGKIDILVRNGPGPAPGTAADVDDAGVDSASERRRDGEVVGGAGQPPAPPSPGPRLRNWWGSSALVITDSRVSFSDARICCDGIAVRDPSIVLNVGPILDALAAFAGG